MRHIPADAIAPTKEQVLERLTKAEGNAAQYALEQGLVDQLATYDEMTIPSVISPVVMNMISAVLR